MKKSLRRKVNIAIVVGALLVVLYVLSFGPVGGRMYNEDSTDEQIAAFNKIYAPIFWVMRDTFLEGPLVLYLAYCGAPPRLMGWGVDISEETLQVIAKLHVGMKESDAIALMKPASLDSGCLYYGGSGRSRLYFQCSSYQQIWIEANLGVITQVGKLEPKIKWTRYAGDSITVE